jgi:hypothetical protein
MAVQRIATDAEFQIRFTLEALPAAIAGRP